MPIPYKVKIQKDGLFVEAEGDKEFVQEILKLYSPLLPQSRAIGGGSPVKLNAKAAPIDLQKGSAKAVSAGEFARRLSSGKHIDIVLAFGYYLEKLTGLAAFTPADINNCYYDAKLESSNTSQMIIMNTRKGFMMAAKKDGDSERKKYTLTSSGEKHVESLLAAQS